MDATEQLSGALAGRYTIEREIGRGGMATVFLARDLRHGRLVALKVLDPELGAVLGAERFLSEIRVTATLQHPNLLPLFDSGDADGLLFYVMPFVDGESLRARLDREKQLPVEEALRIATSIAGALDYAHRHGVIHRDLKPENILLHEGQPLVADFGIALAVSNAGGARITQTGLSLGTPQYMSPEQATGDRAIDGRTDIYSLGAVLYEMLTGDPPHLGGTAQAVIAKVLTERPRSVRVSRASVSTRVSAAIDRSLEKLPADRFATAHDFDEALRGAGPEPLALGHTSQTTAELRAGTVRRPLFALAGVGAIALAALGLAAWGWLRKAPPPPRAAPARFVVTLPQDITLDNVFAPLTISHDGRTIIFRASISGAIRLVRRAIDEIDVREIAGTDGAGWPAASPDNKWVAYRTADQYRKTPIDGGPSVRIATVEENGNGIDWTPSDMLVIGSGAGIVNGLRVVPASGGELKPLTKVDTVAGEVSHIWPRVLSDGNTIVFVAWPRVGLPGAHLAVTTLRTGESHVLDVAGTSPLGVFDGHLIYTNPDGVLSAVPFDVRAGKVTGAPIALIEGINMNRAVGAARVALSDSGTLVYLSGERSAQLVTSDLAGVTQPLIDKPGTFQSPTWSPDGRRIALTVSSAQGDDIWLFDLTSKAFSRLTTDGNSSNPEWSADGTRVLFESARGGTRGTWWQPVDGSKPAELLFAPKTTGINEAILSPDGRWLVYRTQPLNELYLVDLDGDRREKRFIPTTARKYQPALSHDGKWIAYVTDESGAPQVVARPFPGPGGTIQISSDGGTEPAWAPGDKTLYYRHGRQVIGVSLTPGPAFTLGARRVMFEGQYASPGIITRTGFDVSPDGKHFVLLRRLDDDARLIVTTNWFTELRARIGGRR